MPSAHGQIAMVAVSLHPDVVTVRLEQGPLRPMNRSAHAPASATTATPPPPGFRQRARRWVTAGKTKSWWVGLGLLRFHCSLYLAMVPILFLINLIQSPAHLWIDRAALAWLALLVVHAAIVGLIWAIAIWQREATVPERAPGATPQPRSTWITSRAAEPQDAEFRTSGQGAPLAPWGTPPVPPTTHAAPAGAGESTWGGHAAAVAGPTATSAMPEHPDGIASRSEPAAPDQLTLPDKTPDPDERVSWRTVTDAAWLTPAPTEPDPHPASSTTSPADEQKPT